MIKVCHYFKFKKYLYLFNLKFMTKKKDTLNLTVRQAVLAFCLILCKHKTKRANRNKLSSNSLFLKQKVVAVVNTKKLGLKYVPKAIKPKFLALKSKFKNFQKKITAKIKRLYLVLFFCLSLTPSPVTQNFENIQQPLNIQKASLNPTLILMMELWFKRAAVTAFISETTNYAGSAFTGCRSGVKIVPRYDSKPNFPRFKSS